MSVTTPSVSLPFMCADTHTHTPKHINIGLVEGRWCEVLMYYKIILTHMYSWPIPNMPIHHGILPASNTNVLQTANAFLRINGRHATVLPVLLMSMRGDSQQHIFLKRKFPNVLLHWGKHTFCNSISKQNLLPVSNGVWIWCISAFLVKIRLLK